jgi:2-C-methyl-D-erythritol 4-phosphate cytidylyltransferase
LGLVPAAGRGLRFGDAEPKQFLEIAGRSALAWSLHRLRQGGVTRLVVALPPGTLEESGPPHWEEASDVTWIEGGARRQDSVAKCLAAAEADEDDLVAVHDAARAAVDPRDVARVVAAALWSGGAVLGRPVGDTVKRIEGGRILATVDRGALWRAETPQVFRAGILRRALTAAAEDGFVGTDEASVVERGGEVEIEAVTAQFPNPKLTWRGDEVWLAALLGAHEPAGPTP